MVITWKYNYIIRLCLQGFWIIMKALVSFMLTQISLWIVSTSTFSNFKVSAVWPRLCSTNFLAITSMLWRTRLVINCVFLAIFFLFVVDLFVIYLQTWTMNMASATDFINYYPLVCNLRSFTFLKHLPKGRLPNFHMF